MMRFAGQIYPDRPNYDWLSREHGRGALLHVDAGFDATIAACRGRLAYLATPYTRNVIDRDGLFSPVLSMEMQTRAARWAWRFAIGGVTAMSPIVQACSMLAVDFEQHLDPLGDAFWSGWCQPMLMASGSVIVPAIYGWEKSTGIWREVCWAIDHNVPVWLVRLGSEFGGDTDGI